MIITHGIHSRIVALQAKSEFNQNNERIIVSERSPENAARFLAEINETILSRTLKFTNDSGAQIGLEVVGRRVLRVALIENLTTDIAIDGLVGKPLSDSEKLEEVTRVIRDFTDNAEEISIVSSELEMGFGEYMIGLPVADLSKRILGENYKSEFSEKTTNVALDVLTHLDDVEAWLIIRNDEDWMSFGDPTVVSTLQKNVENNLKNIHSYLDQLSRISGDKICTIIGKVEKKAKSIICMRTKNELAFAIVPSLMTSDLLSYWKSENKLR